MRRSIFYSPLVLCIEPMKPRSTIMARHHAALVVATRQATAAMAAALQRQGSLSLRLTAALSGWDGHYLLAHAIQVGDWH